MVEPGGLLSVGSHRVGHDLGFDNEPAIIHHACFYSSAFAHVDFFAWNFHPLSHSRPSTNSVPL